MLRERERAVGSIMSEQELYTSVEQCIIIKFLSREAVNCNVRFQDSKYKDFPMAERQCIHNMIHGHRPSKSICETNILAICKMFEGESYLTVREMAVQIEISYGSASFEIIWVTEKCRQDGFLVLLMKIRNQAALPCVNDF